MSEEYRQRARSIVEWMFAEAAAGEGIHSPRALARNLRRYNLLVQHGVVAAGAVIEVLQSRKYHSFPFYGIGHSAFVLCCKILHATAGPDHLIALRNMYGWTEVQDSKDLEAKVWLEGTLKRLEKS